LPPFQPMPSRGVDDQSSGDACGQDRDGQLPFIEPFKWSVAVMVRAPVVISVTLIVATPESNVGAGVGQVSVPESKPLQAMSAVPE